MKKFMVIYTYEGTQGASFFDTAGEAENCRMDLECGLGAYAEVYERKDSNHDMSYYEFSYC